MQSAPAAVHIRPDPVQAHGHGRRQDRPCGWAARCWAAPAPQREGREGRVRRRNRGPRLRWGAGGARGGGKQHTGSPQFSSVRKITGIARVLSSTKDWLSVGLQPFPWPGHTSGLCAEHSWELGLVLTLAGPVSYWVGEGGRWARPSWGLLSAFSFFLAPASLGGLDAPPSASPADHTAVSGALARPPRRQEDAPPPRTVRAVFLLQTFGTQQAKSGSRACTPPTTTRPTPASWYAACWEAEARAGLAEGWRGEGGAGRPGWGVKGWGPEPSSAGLGAGGRIRAGFRLQRFWMRACLGQRLVRG